MKKIRMLSVFVCAAVIMTCFAAAPAFAKVKKGPMLVKEIMHYYYNSDTHKLVKSSKEIFKYKKKYPLKQISVYKDGSKSAVSFKYKFKKGRPVNMAVKYPYDDYVTKTKYNKKGSVIKKTFRDKNTFDEYFYGKNGYLTKKNKHSMLEPSEGKPYKSVYPITYKFILKEGLPKKLIEKYGNAPGEKKITTTTNFNKYGLKTKVQTWEAVEKVSVKAEYKYKMKNGRVVSCTLYNVDEKGNKKPYSKQEYKYTNTKISKKRYAFMINYQTDDSFTPFAWY